jgi:hypothetical protein
MHNMQKVPEHRDERAIYTTYKALWVQYSGNNIRVVKALALTKIGKASFDKQNLIYNST